MNLIQKNLAQIKIASAALQSLSVAAIKKMIICFSESLLAQTPQIVRANKKDLAKINAYSPLYDRLLLTPQRINAIAKSIRKVANLQDPTGQILLKKKLTNGLLLQKIQRALRCSGCHF